MFDSPMRSGRPRKTPPSGRARPASNVLERTTAADMLSFAAAVAMLLTYSQFWLVAVAGENADVSESGLVRAMFFPAYVLGLILVLQAPSRIVRTLLRQPLLLVLMIIAAASWF